MRDLLQRAYGVPFDQISGPGWMSDVMGSNLYEVTATMPAGTTKEQFQAMLQSLLGERFHLAVHHETRNFPGYDLVVAKGGPKLKESTPDPNAPAADGPAHPTFAKDGSIVLPPGPQLIVSNSAGVQRVTSQERSISQFAVDLGGLIGVALGAGMDEPRPRVTDKTGLTGKYDFKLESSCDGCRGLTDMVATLRIVAGRAEVATPMASEPAGGGLPDIFVAIEKQLGLRLEKAKDVPVDVIVVDRVDKVPRAN